MKALLFFLFLLFVGSSDAQTNFSGHYGYTEPRKEFLKRHPGVKKDETGYQNDLVLLRLKDNQYKFWLFVIKGYSGYNSGHIEGVISIAKDSAAFYKKDTVVLFECRLLFRFHNKDIFIDHIEGDCGFGANVTAYGSYPKISGAIPTSRDIANNYQFGVEEHKVRSAKAIIYTTSSEAEPTKKYFVKNDKIFAFDEDNNFVYTQFVTKDGKYIEGWLKKSDLD